MKKLLSLALSAVMVAGMALPVLAADNSTTVTYDAEEATGTTEAYTITVPATMAPGETGEVQLTGTWNSTRQVVVDADDSVTLTNSLLASEQKTLNVAFDGITQVGSNTAAIDTTASISVDEMTDVLFGTWEGTFSYTVGIEDVTQ